MGGVQKDYLVKDISPWKKSKSTQIAPDSKDKNTARLVVVVAAE